MNLGLYKRPQPYRWPYDVDSIVERFFNENLFPSSGEPKCAAKAWAPSLDIVETENGIVVKAELAGVAPENIQIHVEGNVLTIEGEKKEEIEKKGENFHHTERRFGHFRRAVELPPYIDTESVTAEHKNGVLTLNLTKSKTGNLKKIPIKSAQ